MFASGGEKGGGVRHRAGGREKGREGDEGGAEGERLVRVHSGVVLWSGFALCNLAPQREVRLGRPLPLPRAREGKGIGCMAGEKRTEERGKVANTTPLVSVPREDRTSPLFPAAGVFPWEISCEYEQECYLKQPVSPRRLARHRGPAGPYTPFPNAASPIWRSRPRRKAARRVVDCVPHAPPYFSPPPFFSLPLRTYRPPADVSPTQPVARSKKKE